MRPAHNGHRRSRLRSYAAAARHALHLDSGRTLAERVADVVDGDLQKRLTPEQLSSYLESLSAAQGAAVSTAAVATTKAATAAATTKAATTASTTKAVAAQAAGAGTSINRATVTSVILPSTTSTVRSTAISSASAVKSSVIVSSASSAAKSSTVVSSAKAVTSTSAKPSTTSTSTSTLIPTSTSSSATVRVVTASTASSAAVSASASAIVAASSSSGMSTGSIIGIVAAVVVGLVVVGAFGGWLYRKHQNRGTAPWTKINEDATPYTSDKPDDVYGSGAAAPVIGSRRALALARQNAFTDDGALRPMSEVMLEREGNRAGMGAGGFAPYSAYPSMPDRTAYGIDPQGRPYHPTATRAPLPHTLQNEYESYAQPGYDQHPFAQQAEYAAHSRQLLGPHSHMPAPVPLGRPAAPDTYDAMAAHEDFGDLPGPAGSNVAHEQFMRPYDENEPYTPRTATSMSEWSGDARFPTRSRVSMVTPRAAVPEPRLPQLGPISPLMPTFDLSSSDVKDPSLFATSAAPDHTQRSLYGEVARAAGIPEPMTPASASLNTSTSSSGHTGDSSFSAPEPTAARLPQAHLAPNPPFAHPYQHGQPLSPLQELPTPMSERDSYALASSDAMHDSALASRGPLPRVPHVSHAPQLHPAQIIVTSPHDDAAPPYSAATQHSLASSVPSPLYPPPSPGGMSVPGSVTDSPRRWDATGRPVSMGFDEEDAYGGI